MAISRITSQDAKGASTTTSVSATYPGATTSNNLLIASIYSNGGTGTFTGRSGWTQRSQQVAGGIFINIYDKIADGTETTVTANDTAGSLMKIHIYEYTGNRTSGYADVAPAGNDSAVTV